MAEVVLGHYARPQYINGPTYFGSDAFCEPEHGVFGVASSRHHYHLYPISERDVQAALSFVHAAFTQYDVTGLSGTELLQEVLRLVHRNFGEVDINTHIAGIDFGPPSLAFPEPPDDPASTPLVHIILLQLDERRLSIASVGNFLVYVVRSSGQELIFGWDWFTGVEAGGADFFDPYGLCIVGHKDMPEVHLCEAEVRPGDLIVVTTHSMAGVLDGAKLDQLISATRCAPEAVSRRLMSVLESTFPDFKEPPRTVSIIDDWGAAWAIACVEELDDQHDHDVSGTEASI
jgi:hypothetical protein